MAEKLSLTAEKYDRFIEERIRMEGWMDSGKMEGRCAEERIDRFLKTFGY